ncbi:MAG: hypothetical protein U0Z53_01455 [Blastocatellia bacterium]
MCSTGAAEANFTSFPECYAAARSTRAFDSFAPQEPKVLKSERFTIRFDDLENGWLTVRIKQGNAEYTFFPSHVPYDSIRELTDGLGNLLLGDTQATVHWNDEPIEHEFVFDKTGNELSFRVLLLNETRLGKQPEEVFGLQGTLYEIIRPFWVALRDLETRYPAEEYQRRWREPFPVNEMRVLTAHFEKLKRAQV